MSPQLEYYHKNKDRLNAVRRSRYKNDPAHRAMCNSSCQKWIRKNREYVRQRNRLNYKLFGSKWNKNSTAKRYGLSIESYQALIEIHNGRCAICGNACVTGRSLAVDHCHSTGKVRGLLCQKCNHGTGQFNDNPNLLRKAADYVESYLLPQPQTPNGTKL